MGHPTSKTPGLIGSKAGRPGQGDGKESQTGPQAGLVGTGQGSKRRTTVPPRLAGPWEPPATSLCSAPSPPQAGPAGTWPHTYLSALRLNS